MMNPIMPDDISVKGIPRQQWASLLEVFKFRKFQGVVLVRKLYIIGQTVNGLFMTLTLIGSFWGPPGSAIFALIFVPVLFVVQACVIRVFAELAVSVLLIPFMLMSNQQAGVGGGGGGGAQNIIADDLTAYGVPAGGMHGMAV